MANSSRRKDPTSRLAMLERELSILQDEVKLQPLIVPILTFDPEPFELRKRIEVVVQPIEGSFVATFFDANVNASGETQQDAVANLKDLLLSLFILLGKEKILGKGPARQLAVLSKLIRPRK